MNRREFVGVSVGAVAAIVGMGSLAGHDPNQELYDVVENGGTLSGKTFRGIDRTLVLGQKQVRIEYCTLEWSSLPKGAPMVNVPHGAPVPHVIRDSIFRGPEATIRTNTGLLLS